MYIYTQTYKKNCMYIYRNIKKLKILFNEPIYTHYLGTTINTYYVCFIFFCVYVLYDLNKLRSSWRDNLATIS